MQLQLVKSFWGMEGSLPEKMQRIAEAGFVAVEGRPAGIGSVEEFMPLCREYQLDYIAMVLTEPQRKLYFLCLWEQLYSQ